MATIIEETLRKKRDKIVKDATAEPAAAVPAGDTPVVDATPIPAVEPTAPEPTPVAVVADNFEQKFKSAQGIADKAGAELREVRKELESSRAEINRLQDLIAKQMETIDALMKTQKPVEPEPVIEKPTAPTIPAIGSLTEQDIDTLGAYTGLPEVLSKMFVTPQQLNEWGNNLYADLLNRLTVEVAPVRDQVTAIVKTDAQRKSERLESDVDGYLKQAFPNTDSLPSCVKIAQSEQFASWIATATDIYGAPYANAYDDAVRNTFDAKIVARIQQEFLRDMGYSATASPAPDPAPVQTPPITAAAPPAPAIPAALEDQIAIARSSGGDVPVGGKPKPTVTVEEVKKLGNLAWRVPTKENQENYAAALRAFNETIAAAQKG